MLETKLFKKTRKFCKHHFRGLTDKDLSDKGIVAFTEDGFYNIQNIQVVKMHLCESCQEEKRV